MRATKVAGSWAMKGIAHDPASGTFFVGSIYKRKDRGDFARASRVTRGAGVADDLHKNTKLHGGGQPRVVLSPSGAGRPSHSGRRTSSSTPRRVVVGCAGAP